MIKKLKDRSETRRKGKEKENISVIIIKGKDDGDKDRKWENAKNTRVEVKGIKKERNWKEDKEMKEHHSYFMSRGLKNKMLLHTLKLSGSKKISKKKQKKKRTK